MTLKDNEHVDLATPSGPMRTYVFRPAALKLLAGDVVSYWATAEDNKEPHSNNSETAHWTIKIVAALLIWFIRIEAVRGSVHDELMGRQLS